MWHSKTFHSLDICIFQIHGGSVGGESYTHPQGGTQVVCWYWTIKELRALMDMGDAHGIRGDKGDLD
jgi:hypothetical protein